MPDSLAFYFRFPETYLLLGLYGALAYRSYRWLMQRPYASLCRALGAGLVFWLLFFAGLGAVLAVDLVLIMFHVAAVAGQPI